MNSENLQYLITLLLYFSIIFLMCGLANRRNHSLSDYVLGGRMLSGPIVALGAGASDMSGWLLLALPGAFFVHGFNQIWMPIGLSIGAWINWYAVSPRLRIYTEVANDSLTIPAYFDNRFRDNTKRIRLVSALVVLIFFTFYAASCFVGGALLFQTEFDLSYDAALLSIALVIAVYTAFGGFLAISWIDFFQGSLMFIVLIGTPIYTFYHLDGWHDMLNRLTPLGESYFHPFHGASIMTIISLLAWGFGYFGQPHILVRFMAIKEVKELKSARRICMVWMMLSLAGSMAVGIVGHAWFQNGLEKPESVFLALAQDLFLPFIGGILFAAVLSAIMSTISAQLLAASSALTEDFYHRFFRKNARQKELIWISRLTVVFIALIAILLAHDPKDNILSLVSYAWGGLGAAFGPTILFSLFWRRMTSNSALTGIIVGATTVILWKTYLAPLGGIWGIYEIIPGFILSSLFIVIMTLMGKLPKAEILNDFDTVEMRLGS
jgi:sodium/proline symporter